MNQNPLLDLLAILAMIPAAALALWLMAPDLIDLILSPFS